MGDKKAEIGSAAVRALRDTHRVSVQNEHSGYGRYQITEGKGTPIEGQPCVTVIYAGPKRPENE